MSQKIKEFLVKKYPGDSQNWIDVREFVFNICARYLNLHNSSPDRTFIKDLCSGDEKRYWQRLSEALLAHQLSEAKLEFSHPKNGPDLLVMDGERKIWIEVICPEPNGLPKEWLRAEPNGEAPNFPHKLMLLRWTAAIKEKSEKLLGSIDKRPGYIKNGVVAPTDAYVIAINGRLLRSGRGFCELIGITQYPFAVEAVFPVGPYQVRLDRHTFKDVDRGHQFRPSLNNNNGSPVKTAFFLDSAHEAVSAIWATDIDERGALGLSNPMVVVHNPMAKNPVRECFLPALSEYVATLSDCGKYYDLETKDGRLI